MSVAHASTNRSRVESGPKPILLRRAAVPTLRGRGQNPDASPGVGKADSQAWHLSCILHAYNGCAYVVTRKTGHVDRRKDDQEIAEHVFGGVHAERSPGAEPPGRWVADDRTRGASVPGPEPKPPPGPAGPGRKPV